MDSNFDTLITVPLSKSGHLNGVNCYQIDDQLEKEQKFSLTNYPRSMKYEK